MGKYASLHELFAPTKRVKKTPNKTKNPQPKTKPNYLSYSPNSAYSHIEMKQYKKKVKKKKGRREDGMLFNILPCYCKLAA